jgi:hypothetical protein
MKPARIERKTALGMEELVQQYIKSMKISSGLNTHRIVAAWDQASGAAACTIKRYYKGGKLYITLNSSVVRSQLSFQKEALIEKINYLLRQDTLFTRDDPNVSWVTELILK